MSQTANTLGVPPRSLDSVMSGLVRLHRLWDMDDEERQSSGTGMYPHPDLIRVRLLNELIAWLKPAVNAERARWDAEERAEQLAREAS